MSKARIAAAFALTLSVFGCSNATSRHGGTAGGGGPTTGQSGGGGTGGGGGPTGGGGGTPGTGGNACVPGGMNDDEDGDGYTPAQGDCNDCDAAINPGATDVAGDTVDYDCDGTAGDPKDTCDTGLVGKTDAPSIAQAMDLCDSRFLKSAATAGPSDTRARNITASFGTLPPHKNSNMALISNGIAVDEKGSGYIDPQDGTNLSTDIFMSNNSYANPLPALAGASSCPDSGSNKTVYDYTEIVLSMHAPSNANSFSFDFQFFSGEYPNYVCMGFNDQFLAIVQSKTTYPTATNISFDPNKNPITVNSGFFTICDNVGTAKQTNNCKTDPSMLAGTGYEVAGGGTNAQKSDYPGGSTGWLTTTAPINPGEDFTLRLVIFDESDHVLDSAALLDNFVWGVTKVAGPVTGPITRLIKRHHRAPAQPITVPSETTSSLLMCGA
jgi:hypothetical protein